jgi:PST family polysaccharide transporter
MNSQKSISNSIKWSSFAEIAVKFITPITTMILARILAPEEFGILAICTMIVNFAEIIADSGFGKYIIQADFKGDDELKQYATVAFWSHLSVALFIWVVIIVLSTPLVNFLGIPNHESVLIVACSQLVFMSMISTQLGMLRRKFEFKKAFVARIATAIVTFLVSVSLAFATRSYWALIVGNVAGSVINALCLVWLSKWLPSFYYSVSILRRMFAFSFWSLCEGLAHWFIFWCDVFIATQFFTIYQLGLYKNSTSILLSFIGMITASMSPVLLSVLSRLKNDDSYNEVYIRITKLFMYTLLPICISIYFCREFVTFVILGSKWMEAADIIGLWAVMLGISVFIYSFPAEIFKSKGIPKYLFFYQLCYIAFLIPVCFYSARFGFWSFVYARVSCIFIQLVLYMYFSKKVLKWNLGLLFQHFKAPVGMSLVFGIACLISYHYVHTFLTQILLCILLLVLYTSLCYRFYGTDILNSVKLLSQKQL